MARPPVQPADPGDLVGDVVRALVLYALAEVQAGHATTLRVAADGASFSVGDDGRGHAVDRVVDGHPYLDLVYRQLDFPFGADRAPAVQLQGIGLSLVNRLCCELTVTIARDGTAHRWVLRDGAWHERRQVETGGAPRGNTLAGTLRPGLRAGAVDTARLRAWLQELVARMPGLRLVFNGDDLGARVAAPATADAVDAAAGRLPSAVPRIDRVVLRVADLDRSVAFYGALLGCQVVERRDDLGRVHLRAGTSMIDLVAATAPPGSGAGAATGAGGRDADVPCLRVDPFDAAALLGHLARAGVTATAAVQRHFGAEGTGPSLRFTDPDGNEIELKGPADAPPAAAA